MATRKKKKNKSRPSRSFTKVSSETSAGEAMTIAWTVTVTTVLLCNLASVMVYFYVNDNPAAKKMLVLQELLLFVAAIIGILSLALIPIVYRIRRVPPPKGLVVFGVCVATASILAALARAFG